MGWTTWEMGLPEDPSPTARRYRIPSVSLPGHTNAVLLGRLLAFEAWCCRLEVSVQGTRVARYRRYLEALPGLGGWELDKGIFVDTAASPMKHALDRYLYVLREVHELTWISQSLSHLDVRGVRAKLAKVTSGADFAVLDRNTESRNTQFELRIASYFGRAGYELDLGGLTDIVATKGRTTYHVECKRVGSARQLERRLNEAVRQLENRLPPTNSLRRHVGLVAADVTKVAFTRNGLTMALTPEHSRDMVQDKLKNISEGLNGAGFTPSPACALWLQIHIPSLIQTPPMPVTRFSNLLVRNEGGGKRLRHESDRFWRKFSRIDTSDAGDSPPRALRVRNAITIPSGTMLSPDPDVFDLIVATRSLPALPPHHVVMSVKPPGAGDDDWIDFSMLELRLVFSHLSQADLGLLFHSRDRAIEGATARLLLQRFPYHGVADWLDDPRP